MKDNSDQKTIAELLDNIKDIVRDESVDVVDKKYFIRCLYQAGQKITGNITEGRVDVLGAIYSLMATNHREDFFAAEVIRDIDTISAVLAKNKKIVITDFTSLKNEVEEHNYLKQLKITSPIKKQEGDITEINDTIETPQKSPKEIGKENVINTQINAIKEYLSNSDKRDEMITNLKNKGLVKQETNKNHVPEELKSFCDKNLITDIKSLSDQEKQVEFLSAVKKVKTSLAKIIKNPVEKIVNDLSMIESYFSDPVEEKLGNFYIVKLKDASKKKGPADILLALLSHNGIGLIDKQLAKIHNNSLQSEIRNHIDHLSDSISVIVDAGYEQYLQEVQRQEENAKVKHHYERSTLFYDPVESNLENKDISKKTAWGDRVDNKKQETPEWAKSRGKTDTRNELSNTSISPNTLAYQYLEDLVVNSDNKENVDSIQKSLSKIKSRKEDKNKESFSQKSDTEWQNKVQDDDVKKNLNIEFSNIQSKNEDDQKSKKQSLSEESNKEWGEEIKNSKKGKKTSLWCCFK